MTLQRDEVIKQSHIFKISGFSTFYKRKNELIKIFDNYKCQNLELIEYLVSLYGNVPKNNVLPKELIFHDDIIAGYSEDYIKGFTFLDALRKTIPFEKKIDIINSTSHALHDINQFIIIGDINLENLLVSKNRYDKNGYIIDFDFAKKLNKDEMSYTFYKIKNNNENINENLNTDKIKMFISFLSLLYNYNFENLISNCNGVSTLDVIIQKLEEIKNNGMLTEYAKYLKEQLDNNGDIEYFFVPLNNNLEKEIESGRRLIKFQ